MGVPDAAENSAKVAPEKQHGAASDNTSVFAEYSCFRILLSTDYNSRRKREGSTKLGTHGERVPRAVGSSLSRGGAADRSER